MDPLETTYATYSLACWDTDKPCPDCGERVLMTNGEVAWCECGYWVTPHNPQYKNGETE